MYVKNCIRDNVELYVDCCGKTNFMCVDLAFGKKLLKFSAVYRCHDLSKADFVADVEGHVSKYDNVDHVILGDFNIDILNHDAIGQAFLNGLSSKAYLPAISSITRGNNRGGWELHRQFFL